ncbi:hypothetical protein [Curtobacterium aetherium]|uniref:Uncharacterized protein n=1 Tax=Curtobacterium aetherium TaxID=2841594 RepID=A0ACD1E4F3_9MICO|nr:hypothetical protein [Curtobacterium sp. L6-1]QWS33557.1 hypothetical protein KM842_15220 [Curtobacterium sp. L6-1]
MLTAVIFPVLSVGDRVGGALPVALIGAAGGVILIGGVFCLCRASIGTPVLVISMLALMFVSRQIGGIWLLLIPSYILSAFGSAVLGGHLRFLRTRGAKRR